MQIQYYGQTCFKIVTKPGGRASDDIIVYIDPLANQKGVRAVYGHADLVLFSYSSGYDVSNLKGDPVVFEIPGEYSFKGINIIGINESEKLQTEKETTLFVFETEEMRIAHLGSLLSELSDKQLEVIDGVDILLIPIGGNGISLDGKKAAELVRKIEPSVVVPMQYATTKDSQLDSLKSFCDEMGSCEKKSFPKLTVKKKELEQYHMDVIELEPQR